MRRRRARVVLLSATCLSGAVLLAVTGAPFGVTPVSAAGVPVPGSGGPLPVPPLPAQPRAAGVTRPPANVLPAGVGVDGELASLRSASSRTFATPGGGFSTRVFASPVNYRDTAGVWQKIDTTLVGDAGGVLHEAASAAGLSVPSVGSAPVTVGTGSAQVSFALVGAAPVPARVVGPTATYAGVLPGVTRTETALGGGVKEDLVLADAGATRTFTETAGLPAGASLLAEPGGAVAVVGGDGSRLGVVSAPVVTDAAGVSSLTASSLTVRGSSVVLAVDPGWLAAPGRVFPVDVDPGYLVNSAAGTQVEGGSQQSVNYGSASVLCAGRDPGHANAAARALYSFGDIGAGGMPRDAEVGDVQIGVSVASVSAATTVDVRPLTRAFTQGSATWLQAGTGTAWTTAGGDAGSVGANPTSVSSTDAAGNYHTWWVDPATVTGWLAGTVQAGFMVRATDETVGGLACFQTSGTLPYIKVDWRHRQGIASNQQYFTHPVDGGEALNVNLADGNLADTATELAAPAPGFPLSITRTWNATQATQPFSNGQGWFSTPADSGAFGYGQAGSTWGFYDGSEAFSTATSGNNTFDVYHPADYAHPTSGAFTTPAATGITATSSNGNYTFTNNKSQTVEQVTSSTAGQTASVTSRAGNVETIAHGSATFPPIGYPDVTSVTDTAGRVYTPTFAPSGYLTGWSGPSVNGSPLTTGYTYTGGPTYSATAGTGELLTATDTNGGITRYAYDAGQRITGISSPAGRKIVLTYDGSDRVTSMTYNTAAGCDITNTITCSGDTYTFGYTQPSTTGGTGTTVVTAPLGGAHTTTYGWNSADEVTRTTDGDGHARSATFTPNGDRATLTANASEVTTASYDSLNNPTSVQAPDLGGGAAGSGRRTSFGYTTSGQASPPGASIPGAAYLNNSVTDTQGKTTTATYDGMGLVSSVTPPAGTGGVAVSNLYQGESGVTCGGRPGQVCSSADGNGHSTGYGYDAAGNLTTVSPPAPLGATTRVYDALGEVVMLTDGKGQVSRNSYDRGGHVTQVTYGGTTTCTSADIGAGSCISYGYDPDGHATTQQDSTGTISTSYDPTGGVTSRGPVAGYTSQVTYDADGAVTSFTDDGGTVTYTYDNADLLTALVEPGGTCTGTHVGCTVFYYDGAGRRNSTQYQDGEHENLGYDTSGRVTSLDGTRPDGSTFFHRALTYTTGTGTSVDTGLLQSTADTTGGATTTSSYGYDVLSRLTAASTVTGGSTTSYGYGYDPAGNRTSSTKTGTAQQYYAYNPADELCVTGTVSVSSPTGACPTSAPAGDTVSGYDGNGNLTAAALPAGASTLAYNSKNQTVSSSTAGTTSSYGYAGASQVDRTYAGPVGHSTSLLGTEGRVTNGPTYAWVTRTPDGQPIDIRQGSGPSYTPYYYLLDQQGTVLALTQNGAYSDSATYTYDPYGQTLTATSTGTTPGLNPLRYATGTLDPSTGLTKLGLRYYNPNQGRFTQTDPTRRDQLTYAYVGDNAQNYIDPSGAFSFGSALAGIALTAAVVAVVVIAAPETLAAGAVYVVAVDTGLASGAYDIGCAVKRGGC